MGELRLLQIHDVGSSLSLTLASEASKLGAENERSEHVTQNLNPSLCAQYTPIHPHLFPST